MIYTVFSTTDTPYQQWQSELLAYSWKRVGQPGELVRLVATHDPDAVKPLRHGRTVATQPWQVHPLSGDYFPPYNKPASLLEWLYTERPKGTILLIDPDCVFRAPVRQEVAEGRPAGQEWVDLAISATDACFGLGPRFDFLAEYSTRSARRVPRVMIPTLVHSRDLMRIVARWLELTSLVRERVTDHRGSPPWESDRLGYAIAAAEYGLEHEVGAYGICTDWSPESAANAPIIHYCRPIVSQQDEILFAKGKYQPWQRVPSPSLAKHEYGRDLLALVNTFVDELQGETIPEVTRSTRPRSRPGVVQRRYGDEILLEAPWCSDSFQLNVSAHAIWSLCDGRHTVGQISDALQQAFACREEDLWDDLNETLLSFQGSGIVEFEEC